MMEYTMIALIGIAFVLFIFSFFAKDHMKNIEEQLDHLTLSLAQETYQIKKRLKVLEEELLMNEEEVVEIARKWPANSFSSEKERILALYKQGLSYEQIARESGLTLEEVKMILRGMTR
ncbi:DUF6115 domain-containing protein [Thermaerobacillus caldiproteolyticus]|uniref:DNA-binding NarL/FixJ family response regulator n=1 Tax=Thermaerobacillus caldiproteolyticus TaxID=247480 RepID=A0A7V9Z3Q5_9BACL|nr:hypothetical protein [Anoxybacillus caldiproteolyticus]MBA2873484.1 DNA-binding NarL/FixJ family response regulator [Anoxybacillus caldiproteolyticus]QPA30079.1 hypothetical protein ISX45_10470 [Anoxybacillus caldiproteolyticus]